MSKSRLRVNSAVISSDLRVPCKRHANIMFHQISESLAKDMQTSCFIRSRSPLPKTCKHHVSSDLGVPCQRHANIMIFFQCSPISLYQEILETWVKMHLKKCSKLEMQCLFPMFFDRAYIKTGRSMLLPGYT